jgi:hypothetical protein
MARRALISVVSVHVERNILVAKVAPLSDCQSEKEETQSQILILESSSDMPQLQAHHHSTVSPFVLDLRWFRIFEEQIN